MIFIIFIIVFIVINNVINNVIYNSMEPARRIGVLSHQDHVSFIQIKTLSMLNLSSFSVKSKRNLGESETLPTSDFCRIRLSIFIVLFEKKEESEFYLQHHIHCSCCIRHKNLKMNQKKI